MRCLCRRASANEAFPLFFDFAPIYRWMQRVFTVLRLFGCCWCRFGLQNGVLLACAANCAFKSIWGVICIVSRETTCYNIDNAVCGQSIAKGMPLCRKNGGLVSRETFMAWCVCDSLRSVCIVKTLFCIVSREIMRFMLARSNIGRFVSRETKRYSRCCASATLVRCFT